jgi:uncharacterized protein
VNSPPSVSWLHPRVEVRDSPIEGRGLFALGVLQAGEPVVRLGGRLIDDAAMARVARTEQRYSAMRLDEDSHLLMASDDPASHGNHSCDPNLWLEGALTEGALTIVARHDIAPGEELTLDYALVTDDDAWSMSCSCGATTCRGIVTGKDWQLPELQERYRGHFLPYIEDLMAP